jgi:tetratricopeptide (TPR) repeat protein
MLGAYRALLPLLILSLDGYPADLGNQTALDSVELSARGDRLFRQAHFEEAEATYRQAIDLDRTNLQGQLGLGKIAAMLSETARAARYYSAAYQLDPLNPDAILGYANAVENPAARQTLLRNFLTVSRDRRAEDVKARLQIADRMGTDAVAVVQSPGQFYRISLQSAASGLLLPARIDGGRTLRLLIDTGASGVVLNAAAAAGMRLEFLADAAITGFGSGAPAAARVARAASFDSGALKILNLPIQIAEHDLIPGVDGVVGLDVFRDFLIQLNFRTGVLDLTPAADAVCPGCRQIYRLGHLLLMPGTIHGRVQGYFLIDSGSTGSLIARTLVFEAGTEDDFGGAQGRQQVSLPATPVVIRIGGRSVLESRYAIFHNSDISASLGTEIAGVLGYSFLRDSVLTIDYRAGLAALEAAK